MAQALKDTDAFILMEFRRAATEVKKKLDWVNSSKEERTAQISPVVAPYLRRLANNGWPQRDRIMVLIEIWDEV